MKTKICTNKKCLQPEKPIFEFSKNKNEKDGLSYWCKECVKEYYLKHKKKLLIIHKIWLKENKEKTDISRVKWENKNKNYYKEYRDLNPEKTKKASKKHRDKLETKNHRNQLLKKRRETDINFRILSNLRSRLNKALKNNSKSKRTIELLGCSIEKLKKHLESQFTKGMTWDNWSLHGWHIDHIKPCDSFDMTDPKQQEICFNFKNLQPLRALDNMKKGSKI